MRYYFHVRDGDQRYNDQVGVQLKGLPDAWLYALSDARNLARKRVLDGPIEGQWLEIADEAGAVVAALPVSLAICEH